MYSSAAADKVWDKLLQGLINEQEEATVRCLLDRSDFVEDQDFPVAHKIVLGMSLRSLEKLLYCDSGAVHEVDFEGRTALSWAAMRGDDRSVATLLAYGADPNIVDKKHETALSCCCVTGKTLCARLLLEAGAHTTVILPPEIGKSSPLNCAAQYPGNDPLLLKILIEFGADVNARNPEGETALHKVAQFSSAAHARILLQNKAKPNICDLNGKTPLVMAITHNNHSVLQLLLDSWSDYPSCPRLDGLGILHHVASYADLKTIGIIASSEHLLFHHDEAIELKGSELATLRQRPDADESLLKSFDDLFSTIKGAKNRRTMASLNTPLLYSGKEDTVDDDRDSLLEKGLLDFQMGTDERWYSPFETMQSSLASLDDFKDAEEHASVV